MRAALPLVALALLVAACGSITVTEPPATPTDFPGLAGRLNAAGIEVRDWVSGDAGCDDPDLVPAASTFSAYGHDQAAPVTMRAVRVRNPLPSSATGTRSAMRRAPGSANPWDVRGGPAPLCPRRQGPGRGSSRLALRDVSRPPPARALSEGPPGPVCDAPRSLARYYEARRDVTDRTGTGEVRPGHAGLRAVRCGASVPVFSADGDHPPAVSVLSPRPRRTSFAVEFRVRVRRSPKSKGAPLPSCRLRPPPPARSPWRRSTSDPRAGTSDPRHRRRGDRRLPPARGAAAVPRRSQPPDRPRRPGDGGNVARQQRVAVRPDRPGRQARRPAPVTFRAEHVWTLRWAQASVAWSSCDEAVIRTTTSTLGCAASKKCTCWATRTGVQAAPRRVTWGVPPLRRA